MSYWHIGPPGGGVTRIVGGTEGVVDLKLATGEVAVKRDAPVANGVISADGKGVATRALTLAEVRDSRWADAKLYRATKMAGGCTTAKGVVQTDLASRSAITQAAADAINNQTALPSWSISWTMLDNSQKTHSAAEMIAMAAKVRAYLTGCQAASQLIRTKIYAATTAAAVAAVDVTAGYPT